MRQKTLQNKGFNYIRITDSKIPFVQRFIKLYVAQMINLKNIKIDEVEDGDSFAISGEMIFINEEQIKEKNLTEEECMACLAHEMGHYLSGPTGKEGKSYEREFKADEFAFRLGLGGYLMSAIQKICPEYELTKIRQQKYMDWKNINNI